MSAKKDLIRQGLYLLREARNRGVDYEITGSDPVKRVAKAADIAERHVTDTRLFRDPFYRYNKAANRHAEVPKTGALRRMTEKRFARDKSRREVEFFCRIILYKDKKSLGFIP